MDKSQKKTENWDRLRGMTFSNDDIKSFLSFALMRIERDFPPEDYKKYRELIKNYENENHCPGIDEENKKVIYKIENKKDELIVYLEEENKNLLMLFFEYKKMIKDIEKYFLEKKDRDGFEKLKDLQYSLWVNNNSSLKDKLVNESVAKEFFTEASDEEGIYGFDIIKDLKNEKCF